MNIRKPLTHLATICVALLVASCSAKQEESQEATQSQPTAMEQAENSNARFKLVTLPYATNALEPYISQATIELHHGKHHAAYVNNLNKLIVGTEFANMELVDIVKKSEGVIFNNAGQNLNHLLYFTQFSPNGGGEPTGELAKAINQHFGSFLEFKKLFEVEAIALFGAGWTWLSTDQAGNLYLTNHANAGNPVTEDRVPLLGADVWEHAYYLDYENRRAEHLSNFWNIIDWNVVGERYNKRAEKPSYQ